MSLSSVGYVPFTPERRRRQTDREFVAGVRDRAAARRIGPVQAEQHVGQNADLGRAWQRSVDRAQRRAAGNARVNTLLRSAADANTIRRLQQESREGREIIERLQARARGEVVRSAPARAPDCETCRKELRDGKQRPATASQMALIHRMVCERAPAVTRDVAAYDAEIARLTAAGYSLATAQYAATPAAYR